MRPFEGLGPTLVICRFVAEPRLHRPGNRAVHSRHAHHRRQRRSPAADASGSGGKTAIEILGLHWLLAKTEGLHLTSNDAAVRQRTADYLVELAKATRDFRRQFDGLRLAGPSDAFPLEPLAPRRPTHRHRHVFDEPPRASPTAAFASAWSRCPPPDADFMNTAAETVAILERLNNPSFALHLDVKAMSTDEAPANGIDSQTT